MENEHKENRETEWQTQGESLNTSSAGENNQQESTGQEGHGAHKKGGIHNNALYAASMGRPATAQVDPHSNAGLAQTGTNNSYEGPLAAGAGGSAGTGYTSGQPGTTGTIATESDYNETRVTTSNHQENNEAADEGSEHKEDQL